MLWRMGFQLHRWHDSKRYLLHLTRDNVPLVVVDEVTTTGGISNGEAKSHTILFEISALGMRSYGSDGWQSGRN